MRPCAHAEVRVAELDGQRTRASAHVDTVQIDVRNRRVAETLAHAHNPHADRAAERDTTRGRPATPAAAAGDGHCRMDAITDIQSCHGRRGRWRREHGCATQEECATDRYYCPRQLHIAPLADLCVE